MASFRCHGTLTLAALVAVVAFPGACGPGQRSDARAASAPVVEPDAPVRSFGPEVPLAYYDLALKMVKRPIGFTPPVQSRAYAYMGLALYESLVGGMARQQSVAGQLNGIGALPQARGVYYWPLVASAALAEVMRGLWGDATSRAADDIADIDSLEARFVAEFGFVQGALRDRSIEFGRSVGAAVYETSRDDGGDRSYLTNFPTSYAPPVGPGLWVPTAPGQIAMQPFWRDNVQTFVLSSGGDCDQGGPPAYSEVPSSAFYGEALEVYETVNGLTPDQLTIAGYWADGPGTISGPGHSLAITSEIVVQEGADLEQAAEAFARVGIADADAVSSCWWSKYQYNLVRPVTYIRNVIDPGWKTPLPTPPFPEYSSAHSVQTAAALTTLAGLFGDVAFVDHAHDLDGFAPRPFASLTSAMLETGISRLYGGIHFHSAIFEGFDQGRCVSQRVNALAWRKQQVDP
jgi:hypothetical protein